MNFTTFEALKLQPKALPTVAKVNEIRQRYYPQSEPVVGLDPKIDDTFEQVTEDQLETAAYDVSGPASEEARLALTEGQPRALWDYVSGRGATGDYEKMLNELAEASGAEPTTWWADRVNDATPIINKAVAKVKAVTIKDVIAYLASLENPDLLGKPPAPDATPSTAELPK